MSARKEYERLSGQIDVQDDVAGRTGKMVFDVAEGRYPELARDLLREMTELLSGSELTDEQVIILSHAVNKSDWEEVKIDLKENNIGDDECERIIREMRKYKL